MATGPSDGQDWREMEGKAEPLGEGGSGHPGSGRRLQVCAGWGNDACVTATLNRVLPACSLFYSDSDHPLLARAVSVSRR